MRVKVKCLSFTSFVEASFASFVEVSPSLPSWKSLLRFLRGSLSSASFVEVSPSLPSWKPPSLPSWKSLLRFLRGSLLRFLRGSLSVASFVEVSPSLPSWKSPLLPSLKSLLRFLRGKSPSLPSWKSPSLPSWKSFISLKMLDEGLSFYNRNDYDFLLIRHNCCAKAEYSVYVEGAIQEKEGTWGRIFDGLQGTIKFKESLQYDLINKVQYIDFNVPGEEPNPTEEKNVPNEMPNPTNEQVEQEVPDNEIELNVPSEEHNPTEDQVEPDVLTEDENHEQQKLEKILEKSEEDIRTKYLLNRIKNLKDSFENEKVHSLQLENKFNALKRKTEQLELELLIIRNGDPRKNNGT
ncbi:10140_t:CDS:10 [Funneliformis mosseae]|uniref:10140_t:CDS:1 n=1 Tax=Funneliformis mosseae TaxID=27381 RepID=A0A9N9DX18_FUNMO|nr:10140_t:CDS:10 [Funneliformis mosseae]